MWIAANVGVLFCRWGVESLACSGDRGVSFLSSYPFASVSSYKRRRLLSASAGDWSVVLSLSALCQG